MNNYDEIEHKIFLIKKKLENRLTPAEHEELQLWLEASENHRETFRRIQDKKILAGKWRFCRQQEMEGDWKEVRRRAGLFLSPRLRYIRMVRYAAVFAGVCLGVWGYFSWRAVRHQEPLLTKVAVDSICPGYKQAYIELGSGEKIALGNSGERVVKQAEGVILKEGHDGLVVLDQDSLRSKTAAVEISRIVVPRGGEYQLVLADGTKVWLNSDSKLEFPNAFVGKERKVKLCGEAYFEVARNETMPFRVGVDGMEIVVLGTSFNIQAYDETVKTTLVEGAVALKVADRTYHLSPGYEADVRNGQVNIGKADVYEQIAWKDGKFVFREKRLENVLEILSRWYDFDIFYQNATVKDLHFTGNIPRHATINEVLRFLEHTYCVHFNIAGKTVVVSE